MKLIKHHAYKYDEPIVPLTWYRAKFDGQVCIFMICECGAKASLSVSHEIAKDGTVTPSVFHDKIDDGCGYHEMVRLEGFD